MWNTLRTIAAVILLLGSIYCGFQGAISVIRFSIGHIPSEKGSKLRAFYFSACVILGFFSFALYTHGIACVSVLGIFLTIIWIEYGFNNLVRNNLLKRK